MSIVYNQIANRSLERIGALSDGLFAIAMTLIVLEIRVPVAAGIDRGRVFRCVCRAGKTWGEGVSERVVWHVVKEYAAQLGLARILLTI